MANHASHAALPYPVKGARFTVYVPLLDADGDPTAQTTPDTEISEDNAAATDAAEEVSATSGMDGMGMITFTGAETDCSLLAANFKAASGPKATLMTLYPRVLAEVGTGTLSAGSAGGGTLGTVLAYDVTGCFIKTTGGTGGGGTGGANNQARKIVTYTTSTGAFTVIPNWETTPSTDTTYAVLLPEGVTLGMLRALNPTTAGRTLQVESDGMAYADAREWLGGTIATPTVTGVPEVDVTHWLGIAAQGASGRPEVDVELWLGSAPNALVSGRVDATVGAMQANVMTAAAAAADLSTELRTAINGGDYALSTDANGRIRIVDGTGVGELDTASGRVLADVTHFGGAAGTFSGGRPEVRLGNVSHGGASAVLTLLSATVSNAAGNAVTLESTGADGTALALTGHGTGSGLFATVAGGSGSAIRAFGDAAANGTALALTGTGTGHGVLAEGGHGGGDSVRLLADGGGTGLLVSVLDSGTAIQATAASGTSITITGGTTGSIQANLTGSVGSVATNVLGKVLGGGAGTITGVGVRSEVGSMLANVLTASALAADAVAEIQAAITGGAYALSTDAGGRVRVVDGTGTGEIDTTSGGVLVSALATQAKADVNAEVVDCLATDTYAEPGQGTPAATATLAAKINYLYKAWRNLKKQTATEFQLYADDGTTKDHEAVVSDDGTTFTFGEMTTGA